MPSCGLRFTIVLTWSNSSVNPSKATRVNALLADKLLPLIEEDDILWIHDYHLLPFARELRKRG
jgi:hypothetical protein